MADVGIIIVAYNSAAVLDACLDALAETGADIVVIDNGASRAANSSVTLRPGVHWITNPTNRGFAGAVNQGFALLRCPYILLLNPDTVLQTSLGPLREACDLPDTAGAGGQLLDPRGRPQVGFMVRRFPTPAVLALESLLLNRAWPGNPVNAAYRCLQLDYSVPQRVDQPAGAFLMIRRAVWEELGGFDENFWPLWFEDVDFCRRAVSRGYSWTYVPAAVSKHTGSHSISKLTLEMRRVYWYRSLLRYSAKHFGPVGLRAVCLAVVAGSLLRILIESALHLNLEPVAAYGKVVRLAARSFFGRQNDETVSVSAP